MKLSLCLVALVHCEDEDQYQDDQWYGPTAVAGPRSLNAGTPTDADRRYNDMEAIAVKYWKKQGQTGKDKFDERKYWAYGCHCYILGDRPMSQMGRGAPVDMLDSKCRAYKQCQKCVRAKHGENCIGEMVRYTWKWSTRQNTFISQNDPGSCERELFECDHQFVKDTYEQRDVFNRDYHAFWSSTGFDRDDEAYCTPRGSIPVEHECCGGETKPWYWIPVGAGRKQCCAHADGGIIKPDGEVC